MPKSKWITATGKCWNWITNNAYGWKTFEDIPSEIGISRQGFYLVIGDLVANKYVEVDKSIRPMRFRITEYQRQLNERYK